MGTLEPITVFSQRSAMSHEAVACTQISAFLFSLPTNAEKQLD
jgi:hypothetical protein